MNKKILSFVLAMVLCVGLGSSNVFGTGFSVSLSNLSDQYGAGDVESNKGRDKDDVNDVAGAKDKTNDICAVFNYASGVVISMMDQDKTITLYNAGSPFLTMKYNEEVGKEAGKGVGSYTLAGINISGSDYKNVVAKSGGLESFLKKLGVTDKQLQHSKIDKSDPNGIKIDNTQQEKVSWISKAESELSLGINHSISIDFTASGGASVSFATNGKQTMTIGYDGAVIQNYNYNVAGTLETINQLTYKIDEDNKNNTDDVKYYKEAYTTVHLDAYGRQSYVTDTNGEKVTTYAYSSNGSLFSVHDATTNNTTYYSGGHAGFVINDHGFKTTEYFYHENGSLDGVKSYNYDQDTNKVTTTSIAAYRYGKYIGSASLPAESGQPKTFDELRKAVDDYKLFPDQVLSSLQAGAQLSNDANKYGSYTWNGSSWQDSDGKILVSVKDGASDKDKKEAIEAAAKAYYTSLDVKKKDGNNKDKEWDKLSSSEKKSYTNQCKTVSQSKMKDLDKQGEKMAKKFAKNTSPYGNIRDIGIYDADLNNAGFMNLLKDTFGFKPERILAMQNMSNGYSMIGQLSLTIDAIAFKTDTNTNTERVTKNTEAGDSSNTKGKYLRSSTNVETTAGKVGQKISAKLTIMDHGIQSMQVVGQKSCTLRKAENQTINKTITHQHSADPAVEGELWTAEGKTEEEIMAKAKELGIDTSNKEAMDNLRKGFYTNDKGETFAIVNANSINIMDGSGFQAAKGETVLVQVDNATKESIIENGSKSVIFMGNVREAVENKNGGTFLTMTILDEDGSKLYGDGFAQGDEKVQQVKTAIAEVSRLAAIGDKDGADALYKDYVEKGVLTGSDANKNWISENTENNMNNVFDNKKQNYKAGWKMLEDKLKQQFAPGVAANF